MALPVLLHPFVYTIWVPSGEKLGFRSTPAPVVSGTTFNCVSGRLAPLPSFSIGVRVAAKAPCAPHGLLFDTANKAIRTGIFLKIVECEPYIVDRLKSASTVLAKTPLNDLRQFVRHAKRNLD